MSVSRITSEPQSDIKGLLHLWLILWLFMQLSQKLQHIGDKLDMFHK